MRLRRELHRLRQGFPATRAGALARLAEFVPRAGHDYAATRNDDPGPDARRNVSGLSPAIRRRLITEAEVCAAAVAAHGAVAASKFVQEVCWRTYWKGWLEARPEIWRRYLGDVARLTAALESDAAMRAGYARATSGGTGIDAFDTWVRELTATGYLHNQARMNFASIWIFTLKLPWQLGADFFYWHLFDADPASNTLSWRWVAGLQTAGKNYAADAGHIRQLGGGRFAVDAALATNPLPLPADALPEPTPLRCGDSAEPGLRTGLFVTTEDLSVETMPLPPLVAAAATRRIGGLPADGKRRYAEAALGDGLARAAERYGVPAERLDEDTGTAVLRDWAARHRLQQLVTAWAPVGPVADRLTVMAEALARDGVRLVRLRRDWDSIAWPQATRGFFRFRSVIPELLALR